jgi:hypothetical protein
MTTRVSVEQRDGYAAVRISGSPSLGQFVSLIQLIAVDCRTWPHPRGLFDMREVTTLKAVTDHQAIGRAVVEHLQHLEKLASLVPLDRVTGISRKVAQGAGANLVVFVDEAEAIRWLTAD